MALDHHVSSIAPEGNVVADGCGDVSRAASAPDSERQRRLYQTALSNTPDLVCIFDLNCRFVFANPALLKVWGKTWDEAMGRNCLELGYPPWQAEMHELEVRQVVATRQPIRGEVPFTGAHGRRVYDYIFAPGFNEQGEVEGVVVTARDVTDRITAEEALKENEQRFRMMADNIAQFAWIADKDGKIFWLNERWQNDMGVTVEELRKGSTVLLEEDRERVRAKFAMHVQTGTPWEDTFQMRIKDGSARWFLSRATPIRDGDGNLFRWFGTNTDITDFKKADEAVRESRERLQAALQAARAGTFRWDIQTNELDWDEALDGLFGLPPGKTARSLSQFVSLVHAEDRDELTRRCDLCAKECRDFEMEFRVVWPDGSIHWLHDKGKTFVDAAGKPAYMTGACVEVTERKLAEAQAASQRDTLERIVRGDSLESILDALTSRVELIANRGLIATILLMEPDGVTLRPIAGRGSPREWTEYLRGLKIGEEAGSCGTAAYLGKRVIVSDIATDPLWKNFRDEALKHGLRACWSTPIISSENKALGTFAIYYRKPGVPTERELQLIDMMTSMASIAIERRESEKALEFTRAKLEHYADTLEARVEERTASLREAISQMEEFSYTVSHDLRAPLRGMTIYSQALQEDYGAQLPSEGQRQLGKILENAARLDQMIIDVLTFSRLARSEVRLAPVNLDAFVRDLVQHYPGLQYPAAEVIIQPLLPLIGHEPSLTQVISNLLSNAVKFVAPGKTALVNVRTEARGENVRLWVEDNGIGVAPGYQHRLFRMFERVHPNLPYDGTGVGLAIVRKAMERMNGTCGVESDGENGSRFWIELRGVKQDER